MRILLLALLLAAPVHAADFSSVIQCYNAAGGSTCSGDYGVTITTGTDQNAVQYQTILVRVDISSCGGTITEIKAYLDDSATTSDEVVFLVYDDDAGDDGGTAGEPWTKLYESAAHYDAGNTTYQWIDPGTISVAVTSGYVWVGILAESATVAWRYNAASGQVRLKTNTSFTAYTSWLHDSDTHSTAERNFYVTF